MNLLDHASGSSIFDRTSGFVPTSSSFDAVKALSKGRNGYIYKLDWQSNGLDVNKLLGGESPFPKEREIAVPLNIPASAIKDVNKIGGN